ncbi:MAG: thiopurine S-methyltransferase [Halofilum sp. (in: g-proteobacteria)]
MDLQFWRDRWENQEIAFHQETVDPHLQALWPQIAPPAGAAAFVPLCGKSLDLHWLAQRGHRVVGVEISALAAEALFREHGLQPEIATRGAFQEFRHGPIRLLCGDFFDLAPNDLADVRLVHDRAALIALPEATRRTYAAKMGELLPRGAVILLITYDYPPAEMAGPPYPVTPAEIERIYGNAFAIKLVEDQDGLAHRPRYREKGLTRLTERVHLLQRH